MPREFARLPSPDQRQEYEMADRIDRTGGTCRSSDCYPFSGLFDIGRIGNSFDSAYSHYRMPGSTLIQIVQPHHRIRIYCRGLTNSHIKRESSCFERPCRGLADGAWKRLKSTRNLASALTPKLYLDGVRRRPFNYVQYTSSESRTAG